jgi:formamidopyrimidine-DNA glycosylase
MPELPDISAYITALELRILNQPLERVRLGSVFLLRTVDPPLASAEGRPVRELRRIGKRIAIGVEGDLWLVLHLMIAGRLHWKPPGAKLAGRNALAAFDFPSGSLVLTEAGSKRRASLHVLQGEEGLRSVDPGGVEVFSTGLDGFRRQRVLRRNSSCGSAFAHRAHPQAEIRRMGALVQRDALHAGGVDGSSARRGAGELP